MTKEDKPTDIPKSETESKTRTAPIVRFRSLDDITGLASASNALRDLDIARTWAANTNLTTALGKTEDIQKLLDGLNTSSEFRKSIIDLRVPESYFLSQGSERQRELENEINTLKGKIADQTTKYRELKEGGKNNESKIAELQQSLEQLRSKERLRHLLDRVGQSAQNSLLTTNYLIDQFDKNEVSNAFVLSIDVRRSTDLMLKARQPKLFAEFITSLANLLRAEIIGRYGVFDKFTGDGVLAYFPDFYSGEDAGLLVTDAAEACHQVFEDHYKKNRNCFISVLSRAGLGIGIDYGQVTIVKIHGDLTIVGTPVVYACRLSGANAGETLVNQPAYETLISRFSEYLVFQETTIDFKHEGEMLAYCASRNSKQSSPKEPKWLGQGARQ